MDKTYRDRVKCPAGHSFIKPRRVTTAGKKVRTYCQMCGKAYRIKAGPAPVTPKQEQSNG